MTGPTGSSRASIVTVAAEARSAATAPAHRGGQKAAAMATHERRLAAGPRPPRSAGALGPASHRPGSVSASRVTARPSRRPSVGAVSSVAAAHDVDGRVPRLGRIGGCRLDRGGASSVLDASAYAVRPASAASERVRASPTTATSRPSASPARARSRSATALDVARDRPGATSTIARRRRPHARVARRS